MPENIFILLTDTGTWLSKTVKKYTNTPYNHASLSLDPNLEHLYSFGRKRIHNPFYGGFLKEDVLHGVYRKFPNTDCLILKLEITERQKEKITRLIRTFEQREDCYIYNFIGLFGIIFKTPIEFKSMYFCSQFVSEVINRAGITLWDKPHSLVTPNDFRTLPYAIKVYEGKLYEFEPIREKYLTNPHHVPPFSLIEDYILPIRQTVRAATYKNSSFSLRNYLLSPFKKGLSMALFSPLWVLRKK